MPKSPVAVGLAPLLGSLPLELVAMVLDFVLADVLQAHPTQDSFHVDDSNVIYSTVLLPLAWKYGCSHLFGKSTFHFVRSEILLEWLFRSSLRVRYLVRDIRLDVSQNHFGKHFVFDAVRGLFLRMPKLRKLHLLYSDDFISPMSNFAGYLGQFRNLDLRLEMVEGGQDSLFECECKRWREFIRSVVSKPEGFVPGPPEGRVEETLERWMRRDLLQTRPMSSDVDKQQVWVNSAWSHRRRGGIRRRSPRLLVQKHGEHFWQFEPFLWRPRTTPRV